jgi:hypothetical protein
MPIDDWRGAVPATGIVIDREAYAFLKHVMRLLDFGLERQFDDPRGLQHRGGLDFLVGLMEDYRKYRETGAASDLPVRRPAT